MDIRTCVILLVFLNKIGPSRLIAVLNTGKTKLKRDTRCEPSIANQVHLKRGAYQTKALDRSFKNYTHTESSTHHLGKKNWAPRGNKLTARRKTHTFEIRSLSSRIQIRCDNWAYQTKAQNMRFKLVACKHDDLLKDFEVGGSSRLPMTHIQKHNLRKKCLCCVCICCVCACVWVCVCVRERERER